MIVADMPAAVDVVFTCEHVGAMSKGPHTPLREDMRLAKSVSGWSVSWTGAGQYPVDGFDARRSMRFKLPDQQGKSKEASWLWGDMTLQDGSKYAWLNFGGSSFFSPPGYFCSTAVSAEGGSKS